MEQAMGQAVDLRLSEEQRLIRESADAVLADLASSARTRKAMELPDGYEPEVWRHIAAGLGWCAIPVPEAMGGLGLGAVELVQLFEPMGRHLLCSPYFATVGLALPVLLHLADDTARQEWLPAIANGRLRATAPMAAGEDFENFSTALRATAESQAWRLDGMVARLVDGACADLLLLPAQLHGEGIAWFAIAGNATGLRRKARDGWDRSRRFSSIECERVSAHRIDAGSGPGGAQSALALSRLCLAAEQLGGAQACLDLSVSYTMTRKQFGRSIAGFQAVKHRCAEMMVAVESLRSAVYGTAALFAAESGAEDCAREAAMVLSLAKDSYFRCAQEAIQLHGGVGFTWEYDPQLHLKRAQAGSHWMGTASALRAGIADGLLA